MDSNNWRPAQEPPNLDGPDWRTQLQPESRQRIVNKIMDTLKRHLPISGPEGLLELRKIAVRFEEKIYSAATGQADYLRRISLKMLTMETKSQSTPNPTGGNQNLPDPASHGMQSQVRNPGQAPISLPNQSQQRQQLLSQNINALASAVVQNSSSLPSTGLTQTSVPNSASQNSSVQNISGMPQNPVGNSGGQGMPSNMFGNSQRQGRPLQQQVSQQNQQQTQNPQQYIYNQQQLQHLKQKLQQGGIIQPSHMQSHIQPNMLQSTLQSSQASLMQMSSSLQSSQPTLQQSQSNIMQSGSHSGLQQNQQPSVQQPSSSVLPQHSQSILRQQQQTSIPLQQQQQQPLAGPPNATNMQHNQLLVTQNSVLDNQQQQQQQQQQQPQRMLGQQQQQQQQQQQLLSQQNNISNSHQQQLVPQNSVGLQQQQLLGNQSGISSMQQHPHSMHILQQQHQPAQTSLNLLQIPGQQSQSQTSQQQLMPQLQQQHLGMQNQANPLQRDIQQRLHSSGLQPQNVIQSQRPLPEASSTSIDSTAQTGNAVDWQEEVYQKIKSMKELYYPELHDMYQKFCLKFQQHNPLTVPKDQIDKFKMMKMMLERIITFLQVSKPDITPGHKEKMHTYEKNITGFLQSNRAKKFPPQQGQQQLQPNHPLSMQQQHPQSQVLQQHDNQMNSQMQAINMQTVSSLQSTAVTSMPHSSVASLPTHMGVPAVPPNIMNSLQPGSTSETGQGNASSSLQQGAKASMQQNTALATQQANINTLQPNINSNINSIQLNSTMLQHPHLKQQQEQQMKQQFHPRQMHQQQQQQQQQQQLMQQKQQILQQHPQLQQQFQQQSQQKQQQSAQMQAHQLPQLHQMSEELKMRPGMGFKSGMIQQHPSVGQRSLYHNQQLKSGAQFPISSPQLLSTASPQMSQHSSPQIDQQSLLTALSKNGTPLQSANSPFIVPSPSTPLAPSPIPGEPEKQLSAVSNLSNVGNSGQPHTTTILTQAQSLSIGTPGMSASPLLAEFIPDGNQGAASISVKAEQPLERLIKAVKTMSPKALSASVSDIGSVISMIDRIAGSAPGNGSRAAVGEDLVALTKCRMQARNFIAQDGNSATKKMRRDTSAMPLNAASSAGSVNDGFKHLNGLDTSDLESTATSSIKRPKVEANHALLEEIREINQRLIDTVVDISDEDVDPTAAAAASEGGEGTVVKCSFNAVALSPNLKSQYASTQMSPIMPLRLLVPTNYPNCSPILLDKLPVELSKEYEDLSVKARSRFSISLRSLSQPMSLGEMVRTWDVCARAVIADFAQQSGGGSFSSRYGSWENCVSAA